jgi:hypothetical protein
LLLEQAGAGCGIIKLLGRLDSLESASRH